MPRILTGLAVLITLMPAAVHAQSFCAERESVVKKLESGYGEAFAGGGLQNASRVFEVWMSEEKGTWTILMTRSDGVSCVMATGTNWRDGAPVTKTPAGIPG